MMAATDECRIIEDAATGVLRVIARRATAAHPPLDRPLTGLSQPSSDRLSRANHGHSRQLRGWDWLSISKNNNEPANVMCR